jgi:hypothetical protein
MRNEYMYIHVWNNSSHQQSETQLSYLRLPVAMSWHATYLINISYSPSLLVLDITLPLKSSGFTNHLFSVLHSRRLNSSSNTRSNRLSSCGTNLLISNKLIFFPIHVRLPIPNAKKYRSTSAPRLSASISSHRSSRHTSASGPYTLAMRCAT